MIISALDPRVKSLPFLSDEERFTAFSNLTTEAARTVPLKEEGQAQAPVPQPAISGLQHPHHSLEPEEVHTPDAAADKPDMLEPPIKKSRSLLGDLLGDTYITHTEPAKSKMEACSEEMTKYKDESLLPMEENPLDWWKLNEHRYPHLAKLAKCYLSIPATSVPAERVFSTAGDILTDKRAALKPKHVDRIIFLRKNMK